NATSARSFNLPVTTSTERYRPLQSFTATPLILSLRFPVVSLPRATPPNKELDGATARCATGRHCGRPGALWPLRTPVAHERFRTCPCRPMPEGLPPSCTKLYQLSCRDQTSTAHGLFVFETAPHPLDKDVVLAPAPSWRPPKTWRF